MTTFFADRVASLDSTAIDKIAYNDDTNELLVEFVSGGDYVYSEVPTYEYESLVQSSQDSLLSVGHYYRDEIAGHYDARRVYDVTVVLNNAVQKTAAKAFGIEVERDAPVDGFQVGDRVRIASSIVGGLEHWIGLEFEVVQTGIDNNVTGRPVTMLKGEGRPDLNYLSDFYWTTSNLEKVEDEPEAEVKSFVVYVGYLDSDGAYRTQDVRVEGTFDNLSVEVESNN